jgi:MFS family permease
MSSRLGHRAAFAAVAFALAVAMLGTTLPTPLYDLYRARFGFSELMVTVVFAVYALGVIGSLLLFGRVSDQIGRRRTLLAALALSALSAATFLLADGLTLLVIGRVVSGLSAGIVTGTATATLVDLAPPQQRARAAFAATVANMGGLGLGTLIAGAVSQFLGAPLRTTFWIDLALLLAAAAGIWLMPEPVEHRTRPNLRPQLPSIPAEVRATFVQAAVGVFAGFAVLGLFTAVTPAFLAQELAITSRAAIGLVVFAVFAASALGQAALGRLPKGSALPAGYSLLIAGMGSLALGLAWASLAWLVVGAVVAGAGQGIGFRAGMTAVTEATPIARRAGTASALFVVAYAALALPVLGEGVLAAAIGLRPAGLVFAGVVASLCAAVLVMLWRRHAVRGVGARVATQ